MTDFIAFARAHGVLINTLPPVGRWVRLPSENKPRKRNAAVKYLGDVGFLQVHGEMDEVAVWHPDGPIPEARRADIAAMRRDEERRQREAIAKAWEYFRGLPDLRGGHPYLERKGLSMRGCGALKIDGDLLVIPARKDGFLRSLQTIAPDGEKRYRAGCPVRGASYMLAPRSHVATALCEGFATGLAIYQALRDVRVIVCFDAGNMVAVAEHLSLRGLAVICADNDLETERTRGTNPGIEKATAAAAKLGCGVAFPEDIEGTDWCDALTEWGERGPGRMRMKIMREARIV